MNVKLDEEKTENYTEKTISDSFYGRLNQTIRLFLICNIEKLDSTDLNKQVDFFNDLTKWVIQAVEKEIK